MTVLDNRTALVTGAAQGVGRGIALELARAGANIVIADLKEPKAEEVVAEIKALGRDAVALSTGCFSFCPSTRFISDRRPNQRITS